MLVAEKEATASMAIPEPLRLWSTSRSALAAWVVAGAIGYVLWIRPKWYPTVEHERAKPFTPKEVRAHLLPHPRRMLGSSSPTRLAPLPPLPSHTHTRAGRGMEHSRGSKGGRRRLEQVALRARAHSVLLMHVAICNCMSLLSVASQHLCSDVRVRVCLCGHPHTGNTKQPEERRVSGESQIALTTQ